ncbi:DUF4276 family protein [Caballeronia humi]|uniref:DUF4276 family protein n=1 Tax=Caballeronia humi TaxID=326474 RepID=A0A158H297_9BURK|nr:DUF4276 family protein [Caballeronia humi]SAL38416.1 hypothetical protein AWB65_02837 [Caballeronia humi]
MHFEILVEDQSGKKALDILVPKIVKPGNTFKIISYKGIGRIPGNLNVERDPAKRILLDQLPKLLKGYGNAFSNYPVEYPATVVLVCDLDEKELTTFKAELHAVLASCNPAPMTRFCIAIEEGEAWFLGDIDAVKAAYPNAKDAVLASYSNDSIVGTWEVLANALYRGGAHALSSQGWQKVGAEKSAWAERISPHMDVENNNSPSFRYFRDQVRELADAQ